MIREALTGVTPLEGAIFVQQTHDDNDTTLIVSLKLVNERSIDARSFILERNDVSLLALAAAPRVCLKKFNCISANDSRNNSLIFNFEDCRKLSVRGLFFGKDHFSSLCRTEVIEPNVLKVHPEKWELG